MGQRTLIACAAAMVVVRFGAAQTPGVIDETLDGTSAFTRQDCLGPCACVSPPRTGPLTGALTLRLNHRDTFTAYYDVVDAHLAAMPAGLAPVSYVGTGTYEYGGDFALTHRLRLTLRPVVDPPGNPPAENYDSGYVIVRSPGAYAFPAVSIAVTTGVVGCTRRDMQINTTAAVPPACTADFNGDGSVSVQDIFDFLGAYFSSSTRADVNGDGAVSVQDIFNYLAAYFTGCG